MYTEVKIKMKLNLAGWDRLLRIACGSFLLFLSYFLVSGWWTLPAYILGAIMLITGLTGFCVFYELFGISTVKKKGEESDDENGENK